MVGVLIWYEPSSMQRQALSAVASCNKEVRNLLAIVHQRREFSLKIFKIHETR
jgi:hypothetical protein